MRKDPGGLGGLKILAAEGPSFLQTDGLPLIDPMPMENALLLLVPPEVLAPRRKRSFRLFPNSTSLLRVPDDQTMGASRV
jgi:hypothetical protein